MRRLGFIFAAVLAIGSLLAYADAPPANTTTPANVPHVMVFPFNSVGPADGNEWIGQGIGQSLQSTAGKAGAVPVFAPATQPANENPLQEAAKHGATVAVMGGFQIMNGEIRATGAIVDVASGQPLGVLAATGSTKELFKVEDALGAQLQQTLSQPLAVVAPPAQQPPAATDQPSTTALTTPANPATMANGQAPASTYEQQPSSSTYYQSTPPVVYNSYYTTPSYSYATPYYYPAYYPTYYAYPSYSFWYWPVFYSHCYGYYPRNCYYGRGYDYGSGISINLGFHGSNGFIYGRYNTGAAFGIAGGFSTASVHSVSQQFATHGGSSGLAFHGTTYHSFNSMPTYSSSFARGGGFSSGTVVHASPSFGGGMSGGGMVGHGGGGFVGHAGGGGGFVGHGGGGGMGGGHR